MTRSCISYAGSFNAAAPLNNFLAANDDAPGGFTRSAPKRYEKWATRENALQFTDPRQREISFRLRIAAVTAQRLGVNSLD